MRIGRDIRPNRARRAARGAYADVVGGTQRHGDHVLYQLKVAPIVDAAAVQGQPVAALAVIGSPRLCHRTVEWRVPMNGGVALNAAHAEEQAQAVRDLARDHDPTIAPDVVFLRWSADPEGEAAAARARLLTAYLVALGLCTVAGLAAVVRN